MTKAHWLILLIGLLGIFPTHAQDLLPCGQRPTLATMPHVEWVMWCIERPVYLPEFGEVAFTAIHFAEDGELYALNPYQGVLYWIEDTDSDGLADTPRLLVGDLRYPSALASANSRLYIAGDGVLYQYAEGEVSILLDDLPAGRGFLTQALIVHESYLYLGIPAPCDFCIPDNPLSGTVLKMSLDGTEQHIIARGLRYPAAITFYEGYLWVSDIARDGLEAIPMLDELNRIDLASDTIPHFGFPYCIGQTNQPDLVGDFDCAEATSPFLSFPTHSNVFDLEGYHSSKFPYIEGALLAVLAGNFDSSELHGYGLVSLAFDDATGTLGLEALVPADSTLAGSPFVRLAIADGFLSSHLQFINERGLGLYPHRPYDIAISPEGWFYLTVGGGSIYAFRTGEYDPCDYYPCPNYNERE